MTHIYVMIGQTATANDGENVDRVEVFTSRRAAERDAVAFLRSHAGGPLHRTGPGRWIKHASHAEYDADNDGSVTAYAQVIARTVGR